MQLLIGVDADLVPSGRRSDVDSLIEPGSHATHARHASAQAPLAVMRGMIVYLEPARLSIDVSCAACLGRAKIGGLFLVHSHCCTSSRKHP
eukprot:5613417-Pleurochrysis_carterae.AAC.1